MDYRKYIEENTLRLEASYRGGGIEIDLSGLFPARTEPKMTAYQNYLGGGMLGSVQSDANFTPNKREAKKFGEIREALKRYFHDITNEGHDEWSASDYQSNQSRPASAY